MRALVLVLALVATSPALADRCAKITNGVVSNIVTTDCSVDPHDGTTMVPSTTARIGDLYSVGVFSPPTPPPPQTTGLNFLQFMALFTPTEQAAIAMSSDPQVRIFIMMATGASQIDLTDDRVITGVNYLASIGLIAAPRVARVLSGSLQ